MNRIVGSEQIDLQKEFPLEYLSSFFTADLNEEIIFQRNNKTIWRILYISNLDILDLISIGVLNSRQGWTWYPITCQLIVMG